MRVVELWLSGQRFALDVASVDEVLPLVEARKLAGTPDWIVGMARLRGAFVPLLDAAIIVAGTRVSRTMNARTILLHSGAAGGAMRLALLVDRVGEIVTVDFNAKGSHPGITAAARGALGGIACDASGEICLLEPARMLDDEQRKLFRDAAGVA